MFHITVSCLASCPPVAGSGDFQLCQRTPRHPGQEVTVLGCPFFPGSTDVLLVLMPVLREPLARSVSFPFHFAMLLIMGCLGRASLGSLNDPLGVRPQVSLKALKPEPNCLWLL